MQGYEVVWLPGVDHAGISTQTVVEKQLWKKSQQTRHDLGRTDFVNRVWDWKNENGGRIVYQFRRFGVGMDWDRFIFTLDEQRTLAVTEAFVRMNEKGLVYRANRLVNWCCSLRTALSDLEVEYKDLEKPQHFTIPGHKSKYEFGYLTHFAYQFKDGSGEIVVATTRLETMLGDVAVAVHPEDERYKGIVGKELQHPIIKDREIRVIADPILVDMAFGTGAVKITPAHDFNDFECGERNGPRKINIFNDDGTVNHNGGKYEKKMRFDVRVELYKELDKMGLIRGKTPNPMRIGFCAK